MILEEGFEIGRVGGRDQKKYFSNWLDCALIYPVMSFATPSYALVSRRLRHWMPLHKSYNNSFLVLAASSACTPMYLSQQLRARFSILLQILCAKQAALVSERLPVSEGCLPFFGAETEKRSACLKPRASLFFPVFFWDEQGMLRADSYRKVSSEKAASRLFSWELSCSSQTQEAPSFKACYLRFMASFFKLMCTTHNLKQRSKWQKLAQVT